MSIQAKPRITSEEYLTRERAAETKSEYFDGEVFAMSGASRQHVAIVGNVVTALNNQLRGRDCAVYASDLRVKASPTGLYTYPDVVVVCGEGRFEDEHVDTLLNPMVIVEVLSDSTADYDRGRKFKHYRMIDTFVEYVLIAQDKPHVEHFVRQSRTQWLFSETDRLDDTLTLRSIGCQLALAEVYAKVAVDIGNPQRAAASTAAEK
jgi:Uma2 family endonuclease